MTATPPLTDGTGTGPGTIPDPVLPQHRADLRRSGLTDAQIEKGRFYSETDLRIVGNLLHWGRPATGLGACLVLPFFDLGGSDTGYFRVKPDKPRKDRDDKVVKYESPKGRPNHAYFPPGVGEMLADQARPVLLTEGEKKAAKAVQEGFACVGLVGVWGWQQARKTDANGQKTGPRELIPDLAPLDWKRQVVIVFDSDVTQKPDVLWAEWHLAETLTAAGAEVRVVRLPAGEKGAKVGLDDFLVTQGAGALHKLMEEAPGPTKPSATPPDPPLPEPCPWPDPLAPEAFHGLAGDVVRVVGPATEADLAALLIQTLVGFGNLVGRTAYFVAESDKHFANEFAVLVGKTSKGRKGTSWGRIISILSGADQDWAEYHVASGLSSGEGLTWEVRDRVMKRERVGGRDGPPQYMEVESDPGVADKRLLVYEPEFANVLRMIERQGNSLSANLRLAWDTGNLRAIVKQAPARATGAHISVVGHVTAEELRRYLTTTEAANGFGNRHLWVCVKRSKLLPEGGQVDEAAVADLRRRFGEALAFARTQKELVRDDEAREVWRDVYEELSEGRPGMAGALLARGEAHVMRLAMIYALLEQSPRIGADHLLAALAVWEYVVQSVHHVFGDGLGDPMADEILHLLRDCPNGLTRNEIRDSFGRNQSSERLGRALGLLLEHRLVRSVREDTGGRPAERWFAGAARDQEP
jgi:hypothetical protein